jgi:hypothetical protein
LTAASTSLLTTASAICFAARARVAVAIRIAVAFSASNEQESGGEHHGSNEEAHDIR